MTPPRLPLVLVVAFASGCDCGLVGGSDGLILDVEVSGGMLPAGEYAIVGQVDGVEVRIDETLSGGGAQTTGTAEALVGDHRFYLNGAVVSTEGRIWLGFRDGDGGPAEVTVEFWRGDAMLAQQTYTPKYSEVRPNGEYCGPVLSQARDRLVVIAPAP